MRQPEGTVVLLHAGLTSARQSIFGCFVLVKGVLRLFDGTDPALFH